MKTEDNGQGVIDGVETTAEITKKKINAEKRRWRELYTDTHSEMAELTKILGDKGTYHALAIMEFGLAAMRGALEVYHRANNVGSVKISLKGQLEKCFVKTTYKQPHVEDDMYVGTRTINKINLDADQVALPIEVVDFDQIVEQN